MYRAKLLGDAHRKVDGEEAAPGGSVHEVREEEAWRDERNRHGILRGGSGRRWSDELANHRHNRTKKQQLAGCDSLTITTRLTHQSWSACFSVSSTRPASSTRARIDSFMPTWKAMLSTSTMNSSARVFWRRRCQYASGDSRRHRSRKTHEADGDGRAVRVDHHPDHRHHQGRHEHPAPGLVRHAQCEAPLRAEVPLHVSVRDRKLHQLQLRQGGVSKGSKNGSRSGGGSSSSSRSSNTSGSSSVTARTRMSFISPTIVRLTTTAQNE